MLHRLKEQLAHLTSNESPKATPSPLKITEQTLLQSYQRTLEFSLRARKFGNLKLRYTWKLRKFASSTNFNSAKVREFQKSEPRQLVGSESLESKKKKEKKREKILTLPNTLRSFTKMSSIEKLAAASFANFVYHRDARIIVL